jgi:hypothetical protein
VRPASSNNDYLGHVLVTAAGAGAARGRAEAVLAGLHPRWAGAPAATSLADPVADPAPGPVAERATAAPVGGGA